MDFSRNHFELFGLPTRFGIDPARLDRTYRELQGQVHPDKFAHASDTEQRLSMQWATRVNEAYRTLRQPLARAQYLLELKGIDTLRESNTAMPPQFLMEQMEWREAAEEARAAEDADELERLHHRLRGEAEALFAEVERDLDRDGDGERAAGAVRRLMFVMKLKDEIDEAIESLET